MRSPKTERRSLFWEHEPRLPDKARPFIALRRGETMAPTNISCNYLFHCYSRLSTCRYASQPSIHTPPILYYVPLPHAREQIITFHPSHPFTFSLLTKQIRFKSCRYLWWSFLRGMRYPALTTVLRPDWFEVNGMFTFVPLLTISSSTSLPSYARCSETQSTYLG